MTAAPVLQHIEKHISLDRGEKDYFVSLLREETIPKKGLVLKEGQLCRTISYVHTGALRAFHLNKEGKETTIMFAIPDWWITDMFCFISVQPAMLCIEAIEPSIIF